MRLESRRAASSRCASRFSVNVASDQRPPPRRAPPPGSASATSSSRTASPSGTARTEAEARGRRWRSSGPGRRLVTCRVPAGVAPSWPSAFSRTATSSCARGTPASQADGSMLRRSASASLNGSAANGVSVARASPSMPCSARRDKSIRSSVPPASAASASGRSASVLPTSARASSGNGARPSRDSRPVAATSATRSARSSTACRRPSLASRAAIPVTGGAPSQRSSPIATCRTETASGSVRSSGGGEAGSAGPDVSTASDAMRSSPISSRLRRSAAGVQSSSTPRAVTESPSDRQRSSPTDSGPSRRPRRPSAANWPPEAEASRRPVARRPLSVAASQAAPPARTASVASGMSSR